MTYHSMKQKIMLIGALAVAIASNADYLKQALPAEIVIWVLVVCNIVSAILPSLFGKGADSSTAQTFQWVTATGAFCTAVISQLPILKGVLTPQIIVWVLAGTNIISAMLPSVSGYTGTGSPASGASGDGGAAGGTQV